MTPSDQFDDTLDALTREPPDPTELPILVHGRGRGDIGEKRSLDEDDAPSLVRLPVGSRVCKGAYRIEAYLGGGASGHVYRASTQEGAPKTGPDVALKFIRPSDDPKFMAYFRREARCLRSVRSDHCVRYVTSREHNGIPVLVMEHVPGESLDKYLAARSSLPIEEVLEIAMQLLDGLGAMHRRDLVHRDLKPANVMRTDALGVPVFKIIDFGLAKGDENLTGDLAAIKGTPRYMSPEQAKAEPVTPASDLNALGLILYECIAGSLPIRKGSPLAIAYQRAMEEFPSLASSGRSVHEAVVQLVDGATIRDRNKRFQSTDEMLVAAVRAKEALQSTVVGPSPKAAGPQVRPVNALPPGPLPMSKQTTATPVNVGAFLRSTPRLAWGVAAAVIAVALAWFALR